MKQKLSIPPAFSKGYALCNPSGRLLPKTVRGTRDAAISARFPVKKTRDASWAKAQAEGWSVKLVYVRVFIPVFKSTNPKTEEVCDVEDI
ncbi:hypothetical protein [Agrobacterium sp. SORGH_AS 787]|uniref:hypothetical protein n=1 Tax=Agrobacterium sp. SORGH_AS 787 TaxID=3041775 RepID=UPI0027850DE6|nr:hypothetical protein [Rhizobium sp. SORGH_AS_0787]